MSYILDALKKADKRRKRGEIPELLTVHEPMPPEPKKRSLWPYLLLVALLLNAAILVVWLRPWHSEELKVITQLPVIQQHKSTTIGSGQEALEVRVPDSTLSPATSLEVRATEEKASFQPDSTVEKPAKSPVKVTPPKKPLQPNAGIQETAIVEPTSTLDVKKGFEIFPSKEEQPPADIEVASQQRVLELSELPLSVQQDLPNLSITGHIYSNEPTSRMVNINGRIIREGDKVAPSLKLEEIALDGAIFSYQGYRFRIRR